MSSSENSAQTPLRNSPRSPLELFWVFFFLAMQCFGGALAIVQRALIEDKKWYTKDEYVEMFALIQAIPGPNACKVVLMCGERFFGLKGALAALAGFTCIPFITTLACAVFVEGFLDIPQVSGALRAVLAASAGMGLGSALSLSETFTHYPLGAGKWLIGAGLSFALFLLAKMSLIAVLVITGVPFIAMAYLKIKKTGERK